MKIIALLAAVLCCCLNGCTVGGGASLQTQFPADYPPETASAPSAAADGEPATHLTADGELAFTMDGGWAKQEQSVYDLLCVDSARGMSTGVFSYSNSGLVEGVTPLSLLEFHIRDVEAKRENVKRIEDHMISEDGLHRFTTALLSGERDGESFCYYFTLVEFSGFSRRFAVVVQSTGESGFAAARPELDEIAASAWLSGTGGGGSPELRL